ncbi:MAG: tetratricopeptide repeat protein [Chloroflexi bacterium]|nr:tetratricopeptide repeat protein [Chloroflexota bacterium]
MRKKRRRSNPWRVLFLILLVAAALYFERVVVPTIPAPFIPTTTPTRSPASFIVEAESFYEAGKLAQAEAAYQEAIEVDPLEPNYFINLARIQVFAGKYEQAEESASNAVLIEPNLALANAVFGWVLDFRAFEEKDADRKIELLNQAIEKLESALELDPNSALIQAYYAEVLVDYDIERYDDALEAAQRAVQLDPNLMESHRALGYIWESTGTYDRALAAYQTALRIQSSLPMLYISIGNMYQALEDVDSAVDSYLRAVALDPTNSDPLNRIALAYARIGNYGIASQYAADAVDKDPDNPRLHGNLGRTYFKNNENLKAIEELRLAVQGGITDDGVTVNGLPIGDTRVNEFYYTYGLALAIDGQCDLAGQIFALLLRVLPEDEIVVANAQEGLVICGEIEPTPTPDPNATPSS